MPPYKRPKLGGVYEFFKEEVDSWVCQININKDNGEDKKICGNISTKGAEKEGDKGRNKYKNKKYYKNC